MVDQSKQTQQGDNHSGRRTSIRMKIIRRTTTHDFTRFRTEEMGINQNTEISTRLSGAGTMILQDMRTTEKQAKPMT